MHILFLAVAMLLPQAQVAPEGANELFKRAAQLYGGGLFYEAEEVFRRVVSLKADFGQAHLGIAMCLVNTDRHRESLAWFERAEDCPMPEAQFFANHGMTLEVLGLAEEAKSKFERALSLDANSVHAWHSLGLISARQGNFERARECFEACRGLDSNHVEAMYELADIEYREKNYDRAEKLALAIAAIKPGHYKSRYLLSRIHMRTERRESGEQLALEAKKLQDIDERRRLVEKKVGALLGLAFKDLRANKFESAVTYLETVLQQDPANLQARSALKQLEQVARSRGEVRLVDRIRSISLR